MEHLEKIVSELESGDLSLEESIKKFEEGMKLSRMCSQTLDETEKKIIMLVKGDQGTVNEVPFSNNEL